MFLSEIATSRSCKYFKQPCTAQLKTLKTSPTNDLIVGTVEAGSPDISGDKLCLDALIMPFCQFHPNIWGFVGVTGVLVDFNSKLLC